MNRNSGGIDWTIPGYVVMIVVCIVLSAMLNLCHNDSKARRCMDQGGIYNENTTDSSLSFCSGGQR
jgi:hypothetical protein